jgi:hypothetical protein
MPDLLFFIIDRFPLIMELVSKLLALLGLSTEKQTFLLPIISIVVIAFIIYLIIRIICTIAKTYNAKYYRYELYAAFFEMNNYLKNDIFEFRHTAGSSKDIGLRIKEIIDEVAKCLSEYYFRKNKVSVCIKLFRETNDISNNTQFYTYMRSKNTCADRSCVDKTSDDRTVWNSVDKTANYNSILNNGARFFASGHLRRSEIVRNISNHFIDKYNSSKARKRLRLPEKKRVMTLENSHERYWDKYKSTIVFPICIEEKYLSENSNSNAMKTLGFLCIDAPKNMRKWHIKTKHYPPSRHQILAGGDYWLLTLLDTICDSLYYYFDYLNIIDRISREVPDV